MLRLRKEGTLQKLRRVIGVVDKTYILELHNVFTGYMVSSTKYIMNHIMDQYKLNDAEDIKIKKKLQEPLDTSQLTNVFFKVVNYRVQYSIKVRKPFTPAQILQMAYHAVRLSEIYTGTCKDWNINPSA